MLDVISQRHQKALESQRWILRGQLTHAHRSQEHSGPSLALQGAVQ